MCWEHLLHDRFAFDFEEVAVFWSAGTILMFHHLFKSGFALCRMSGLFEPTLSLLSALNYVFANDCRSAFS